MTQVLVPLNTYLTKLSSWGLYWTASGLRNCIAFFYDLGGLMILLWGSQLQYSMFGIRVRLCALTSLGCTFRPFYLYRRYTNIRKDAPQSPTPTVNPSQIANLKPITPTPASQSYIANPLATHQLPKPQKPLQSLNPSPHKITKQQQQISRQINNANKPGMLIHILMRNRHCMRVEQVLDVLDKVVYYVNERERDGKGEGDREGLGSREDGLVEAVVGAIFKEVYAPELYIRFVHVCSKIKNDQLMARFLPTVMKVLQKQLSLPDPQPNPKPQSQPQQPQQSSSPEQPDSSSTLSELIPLESTLKLTQSLLRLAANPSLSQPQHKLLQAHFKNCTNYLHLPSTPARIENRLLWDLIRQYIAGFPRLRVGAGMVRGLVRDGIRRVKYEGLLERVKGRSREGKQKEGKQKSKEKGEEGEQLQISIVNTLKRLLLLQQLLLQQTRKSSLTKQLLETSENNLPYNPFYSLQHKLNKHITQLLPKCRFSHTPTPTSTPTTTNKQQEQAPLWQHIELLPMLAQHVRVIFVGMSVDVMGKCGMLSGGYMQYQAVVGYLGVLYGWVICQGGFEDVRGNLSRLLDNSYPLLHLLLSKPILQQIPKPLTQASLAPLLNNLTKHYSSLPAQLKIITLWYMLENGHSLDTCGQLAGYLVESRKGQARGFGVRGNLWYFCLLAGKEGFGEGIGEAVRVGLGEIEMACVRTVLREIKEYMQLCSHNKNTPQTPTQISQKILQILDKSKQSPSTLLPLYQKLSVDNCLFTDSQIETLSTQRQHFTNKDYKINPSRAVRRLMEEIVERLEVCFWRVEVMGEVVKGLKGEGQGQEGQGQAMREFVRIYRQELMLLAYPTLLRKQHHEAIERLSAIVDKYKQVQPPKSPN